jgi:hypothetical protein
MSIANVVAVNAAAMPPTVSVAVDPVENWADVVRRTRTRWLLVTVPAADVNAPPSIEYSPPAIETAAAAVMPVIVTSAEVTELERDMSPWPANVNAFGVVSGGGVLPLPELDPPPPPPPPQAVISATKPMEMRAEN